MCFNRYCRCAAITVTASATANSQSCQASPLPFIETENLMEPYSRTRNNKPTQTKIIVIADPCPRCPYNSETFSRYLEETHSRLSSTPPARIADVGCGCGESTINLAVSYPRVRIDGYDLDDIAIEIAWANARSAGVTDRVTFHVRDIAGDTFFGRYDFVVSSIGRYGLHEPGLLLRTLRGLVASDGTVFTVAEPVRVEELCRHAKIAGFGRVNVLHRDHAER